MLNLHEEEVPAFVEVNKCLLDDTSLILEQTHEWMFKELWSPEYPSLCHVSNSADQTGGAALYRPPGSAACAGLENVVGVLDIFLGSAKLMNTENSKAIELIPQFKGRFLTVMNTFDDDDDLIPIDWASEIPRQRRVYVLLLEYMPGSDIFRRQLSHEWPVCDVHRAAVMRAVWVAWHKLRLRGITHYNFAGRSILLKTVPTSVEPFCEDPMQAAVPDACCAHARL
ncbi:hypothetical protein B0H17DRAFT_1125000 [Mycena rosella]|uniref:Protein kinase domain-containing protein n=1 Tax=Mycena rosella TaxID=1033263 RepID=A0AAD7GYY8_MYCRO|nr:hypothetical protein B0H17DRAFT_1125000 [Mycena rosella]